MKQQQFIIIVINIAINSMANYLDVNVISWQTSQYFEVI